MKTTDIEKAGAVEPLVSRLDRAIKRLLRAHKEETYKLERDDELEFISRMLAEPSVEKNHRVKNMLLERVNHIAKA
uniref:Uncharacterized protein n=1 Tax=viral metagenome TaxID=1070528 RepID=A0A6H1ZPC4_9ZZZZ